MRTGWRGSRASIVPPRGRSGPTRAGEVDVLLLVEALEPVADADDLPAVRVMRVQRDRANHRVETRTIAAPGEDSDPVVT